MALLSASSRPSRAFSAASSSWTLACSRSRTFSLSSSCCCCSSSISPGPNSAQGSVSGLTLYSSGSADQASYSACMSSRREENFAQVQTLRSSTPVCVMASGFISSFTTPCKVGAPSELTSEVRSLACFHFVRALRHTSRTQSSGTLAWPKPKAMTGASATRSKRRPLVGRSALVMSLASSTCFLAFRALWRNLRRIAPPSMLMFCFSSWV
mmetsp:Transcript_122072/g.356559  ORF Transcript_122072/g.356559 Transcript_122072/m.356559 type:complete len:211 (-) Transcript_122072:2063-2695(-)